MSSDENINLSNINFSNAENYLFVSCFENEDNFTYFPRWWKDAFIR